MYIVFCGSVAYTRDCNKDETRVCSFPEENRSDTKSMMASRIPQEKCSCLVMAGSKGERYRSSLKTTFPASVVMSAILRKNGTAPAAAGYSNGIIPGIKSRSDYRVCSTYWGW